MITSAHLWCPADVIPEKAEQSHEDLSHTTIPTCLYIVEVLLLTFVLWYRCFICIFEILQYLYLRVFCKICHYMTQSCFFFLVFNYLGVTAYDLGSVHFTEIVLTFS